MEHQKEVNNALSEFKRKDKTAVSSTPSFCLVLLEIAHGQSKVGSLMRNDYSVLLSQCQTYFKSYNLK